MNVGKLSLVSIKKTCDLDRPSACFLHCYSRYVTTVKTTFNQTLWKNAAKTGRKHDADLIKKTRSKVQNAIFSCCSCPQSALSTKVLHLFFVQVNLSDLFFNKINTASYFIAH